MNKELDKKITELDNRRAEILFTLCENEGVFHPEILLQLIQEIRSLTKIIRILKGNKDNNRY